MGLGLTPPPNPAPTTATATSTTATSTKEGYVSRVPHQSAEPVPPPYCNRHLNGTDLRCGACADARRAHDAATEAEYRRVRAERRDALARRQECSECDSAGWRLDSPDDAVVKCAHGSLPTLQLVHSNANHGRAAGMSAQRQSGGATDVLERPVIDVAEIVGGMAAKACQCMFVVCPCHENRCDQQWKWAARIHGWVQRGDPQHYKVYDLCDDCQRHIEESVQQLVGIGGACSCGMTGTSVSDYFGPVMPL